MILHLVPDEKFIDFAFNEFEKVISGNKFLVITDSDSGDFKYIKSKNIEKVSAEKIKSKAFISSLQDYEFVVLHYLDKLKTELVLSAPKGVKFVWLGWGADFYHHITGSNQNLYLSKTKNLWQSKNKFTRIKNKVSKLILYKKKYLKAVCKIDFFAPILPNEYGLLKKSIRCFVARYVPFSYGSLDELLLGLNECKVMGGNILLGNSASYANNHIEAIDILAKLNLGHCNVITPLSYGDEEYRDYIAEYGKTRLNDNFKPITDFMDKHEYHQLISSCSIVIMNHLRQQGMGNIVTMMYLGAKIYLNANNPVFEFFKKEGAHVYSIEELTIGNTMVFESLSSEQIAVNRAILEKNWSAVAVENKIRDLIRIVRENS